MGRLEGKIALVTGASRGIGRAIARRYVAEGASVVIADIDEPGAVATAAELGSAALAVRCDVSSRAEVAHAFDVCIERFGTIDVLVNNAGITFAAVRHVLEMDEAFWDFVQGTNLKGHFLCAHRAAREMVERGSGVIINMSSGGASRAHRGMLAYDAAKGGIEAMTRSLALDLGPYGIRVVCLVPGMMVESRETADPGRIASRRRDRAARPRRSRRRHGGPGRVRRRRTTPPTSPDRTSTWTVASSSSSARRRSRCSASTSTRRSDGSLDAAGRRGHRRDVHRSLRRRRARARRRRQDADHAARARRARSRRSCRRRSRRTASRSATSAGSCTARPS